MRRTLLGSSGAVLPRPLAGWYFYSTSAVSNTTSNTLGNGSLRLAPWVVDRAMSIDRMAAEISTVGEAGSKLRLGIYADTGNGYPGALLLDAGQIAGDSATVQELTVSLSLPVGVYWIGGAVQSAATTQPTVRVNSQWYPPVPIPSSTLPAAGGGAAAALQTGVTGALPATFSSTLASAQTYPRLILRAA
jgi:hypothetical protein